MPVKPIQNYKLAEIFPKKNRNTKTRWYVLFYAYNPDTKKNEASKPIWIPDFKTVKERMEWGTERVKAINEALSQGYTFASQKDIAKPNTISLKSRLLDVIMEGVKVVINDSKSEILKLAENGLSQKKRKTNSTYLSTYNSLESYLVEMDMVNISLEAFSYRDGKLSHVEVYKLRDYLVGVKNNGSRTANNVISHLRGLLNHANKRIGLEDNVFAKMPRLKISRGRNIAFSDSERNSIIEFVKLQDKELYLYICFMYYTMFRKDEVRFIRVKDIQPDLIFVNELISKNKDGEFVTIPKHFKKILAEYNVRDKPQNSFVFHVERSDMICRSINYFYNKHVKILKKLKINPACTMHSWRHKATIDAHKAKIPIGFIQNQLRHKSLETTMIYLKSLGLTISKDIQDDFPEL